MTRRLGTTALLALLLAGCASDVAAPAPPRIALPAGALSIPLGVDTVSAVLRNPGGSPLAWAATPSTDWLDVTPATGSIPPGDSVRVRLHVDRAPAYVGTHDLLVRIDSDAFPGFDDLRVRVDVGPDPRLSFEDADTVIEFPDSTGWIYVRNEGKGLLVWSAHTDAEWLALGNPGNLQPYDGRHTYGFRIDRGRTPRDTSALITFTSNDTTRPEYTVRVHVQGTPERILLPLAFAAPLALRLDNPSIMFAGGAALGYFNPTGSTGGYFGVPVTLPAPARDLTRLPYSAGASHAGGVTSGSGVFTPTAHDPTAMAYWYGALLSYIPAAADSIQLATRGVWGWQTGESALGGLPRLHDLEVHQQTLFASWDSGLVRFQPALDPASVRADTVIRGIPFAPRQHRFWSTPHGLITSSGAIVTTSSQGTQHVVSGQLAWAGTGPEPAIRFLDVPPGTSLLHVVRDSLDNAPAPPVVWEYSPTLGVTAIPLPPVDVAGVSRTVEPFAAFYWPGRRQLVVIQRALTPDGNGPWSLVLLRY